MNSLTNTARSVILFLTLFMCFFAVRSQTVVPRSGHKLNEPQGGDIVRQNSITQQILAQYLQKRLNRAGGSVQQIVQPQLLLPTGGNDFTAGVVGLNNNGIQRNVAENLYDGRPDDDDDSIEDARYYQGECSNNNCVEDSASVINKWSLPLLRSGDKKLYLGIFFKANWYKAAQYCRYHGMHLASISSQEENDKLEKYIKDNGLGHEHFWTSGTDQAEEGSFFWLANGRPIGFTNWNAGEPNNFKYENGEEEHCLELWNRDGKGLKWNDSPYHDKVTYNSGVHTTLITHQFITMPIVKWNVVKSPIGHQRFLHENIYKANWYDFISFCLYYGMQLASIISEQEHLDVVKQLEDFGYGEDSHFWTSGNDLSKFIWLGNGQKFRYTNWLKGKSNNVQDKPKAMMKIV